MMHEDEVFYFLGEVRESKPCVRALGQQYTSPLNVVKVNIFSSLVLSITRGKPVGLEFFANVQVSAC